jgi:hypothetical protein
MGLAWKGLIPMGLVHLVGVAIVLSLGLPKHLLILTAALPIAAAYYSSVKFNASMGRWNALESGVRKTSAVSYE